MTSHNHTTKVCTVCQAEYLGAWNQVACKKPDCQAEAKRRRENRHYAAHRAIGKRPGGVSKQGEGIAAVHSSSVAERERCACDRVVCDVWAKSDPDWRRVIEARNPDIMFVEVLS